MDKKVRKYSLISLLAFYTTSAAAQITNGGGSLLGETIDTGIDWTLRAYFGLDQGLGHILYDVIAFVFAWIFAYALFAVVFKLIEDNAPGNTGETFKKVFLGESGKYSKTGSRNYLFWLTPLGLLMMGPYLGPFLNDIQSLVLVTAGSVWLVALIALLLLGALGLTYLTGLFGQGAGEAGNTLAAGAKDFASSNPVQWGKKKGQQASNRFRIGLNNLHSRTKNLVQRYATVANGLGYLVCNECGKWHDPATKNRGQPCDDQGQPWCPGGTVG